MNGSVPVPPYFIPANQPICGSRLSAAYHDRVVVRQSMDGIPPLGDGLFIVWPPCLGVMAEQDPIEQAEGIEVGDSRRIGIEGEHLLDVFCRDMGTGTPADVGDAPPGIADHLPVESTGPQPGQLAEGVAAADIEGVEIQAGIRRRIAMVEHQDVRTPETPPFQPADITTARQLFRGGLFVG